MWIEEIQGKRYVMGIIAVTEEETWEDLQRNPRMGISWSGQGMYRKRNE